MANTDIVCKVFVSEHCGFCKKFLANGWKELTEVTSLNDYNISYEEINKSPETNDIFKEFGVTSFPRTIIVGNDRKLPIIVGAQTFEVSKKALEEGINKIFLDDDEWNKEEELRIKKEKEMLEMR